MTYRRQQGPYACGRLLRMLSKFIAFSCLVVNQPRESRCVWAYEFLLKKMWAST